jgi:hypothetical protein
MHYTLVIIGAGTSMYSFIASPVLTVTVEGSTESMLINVLCVKLACRRIQLLQIMSSNFL